MHGTRGNLKTKPCSALPMTLYWGVIVTTRRTYFGSAHKTPRFVILRGVNVALTEDQHNNRRLRQRAGTVLMTRARFLPHE